MKKKTDSGIDKIKKRVDVMVKERPSHKEVLKFFAEVMTEQYKIRPKVKINPVDMDKEKIKARNQEGFPLVDKRDLSIDVTSASKLFKRLCKVMSRNKKASRDAERITQALRNKDINLTELFKHAGDENEEYIADLSKKLKVKEDVLSFMARNSIKPIFDAYADELKGYVNQEMWWKGYCPICGSEPVMAELRDDGGAEGARFLVCSLCNFEWRFSRVKCPFCENDNHEKLRYFYTEKEGKAYRVDVCEKCKRYIKTVDTKEIDEEVIPLIEDIGTLYLDVLARNEGYTREGTASGVSINA